MRGFWEEFQYMPLGGYFVLTIVGLAVLGLVVVGAALLILKRQSGKVISDGKK